MGRTINFCFYLFWFFKTWLSSAKVLYDFIDVIIKFRKQIVENCKVLLFWNTTLKVSDKICKNQWFFEIKGFLFKCKISLISPMYLLYVSMGYCSNWAR